MEVTYENLAIVLVRQKNCNTRAACQRLTKIWKARCLVAYKAKHPRKKKIDEDWAWLEFRDKPVDDLRTIAARISARVRKYEIKYEEWLKDIADKLRPRVCDTEIEILNVSEASYRPQGWGADKYATGEATATMASWQAACPELTFRYERKFNSYDKPIRCVGGETSTGWYTHHVFANTDATGAYLVEHAKVNMREYYRGLLKAGCNVKVSNPWLFG